MAAPRNGEGKRGHSSRRSNSSSPARSSPVRFASRSPSPRTKRLRRSQKEREIERDWSRDTGRDRERDARNRDRYRDRGKDADRVKNRDRDQARDRDRDRERNASREPERLRDRRGREREPERSRDRRGRVRPVETSPVRSPVQLPLDRSPSPMNLRLRRQCSPSRTSPRHQRGSKNDQRATGTSAAASDEDVDDAIGERNRGEDSPQQDDAVARMKEIESALEAKETNKEKPSFEYSGKLAAETNKVKGVTLQFTEPPEARKPTTRWRLYVFKDGEPLNDPLYIHRQTCYLFGRERRVADIPTDHPSCSKQHAVIQYRLTEKEDSDHVSSSKVRPYVMDLGSTNGTMLNGDRLEPQRYYEMFEKDTIKFGNSSREYVLLHEHSMG